MKWLPKMVWQTKDMQVHLFCTGLYWFSGKNIQTFFVLSVFDLPLAIERNPCFFCLCFQTQNTIFLIEISEKAHRANPHNRWSISVFLDNLNRIVSSFSARAQVYFLMCPLPMSVCINSRRCELVCNKKCKWYCQFHLLESLHFPRP